jgi:hypothetical protein
MSNVAMTASGVAARDFPASQQVAAKGEQPRTLANPILRGGKLSRHNLFVHRTRILETLDTAAYHIIVRCDIERRSCEGAE